MVDFGEDDGCEGRCLGRGGSGMFGEDGGAVGDARAGFRPVSCIDENCASCFLTREEASNPSRMKPSDEEQSNQDQNIR